MQPQGSAGGSEPPANPALLVHSRPGPVLVGLERYSDGMSEINEHLKLSSYLEV